MKAKLKREGGFYALEPLPPRWDENLGSFSLPFFGRARLPSAKNFQLVAAKQPKNQQNDGNLDGASGAPRSPLEETEIFFVFGKVHKDYFCLDFRCPVRPLEAFAMAAAALAKKRVVS